MKNLGKQNKYGADEYILRKSIPFRLSSILKASNRDQDKIPLGQFSKQMEKQKADKIVKTPLIKADPEKNKSSVLFIKNSKISNFESQKPAQKQPSIMKQSKDKYCQQDFKLKNQDEVDRKFFDLIQLVDQDTKKQMMRCQSSASFFLNSSKTPLINHKHQRTKSIFLPEPFYNKNLTEINYENQLNQQEQNQPPFQQFHIQKAKTQYNLIQSTYIPCELPKNSFQKRMSHYLLNKKTQTINYILCINCESYVNKSLTFQHEKRCVGFDKILKMTNSQLIDFLDVKINRKLNELREVQKNLNRQNMNDQKMKSTHNLSLYQKRNKIDKILTDLDSIRLKALKRWHLKTLNR